MRVVSLLPSATEVLTASSNEEDEDSFLVGRSHECDFPPYVTSRPILTAARNKFESCAQMHDAVCTSLAAGEGLYFLDTKVLKELQPEVVITQDLCGVCSVDLDLVRQTCQDFPEQPQIISLNPFTLEDVMADILTVGNAVHRFQLAAKAVLRMQRRIARAKTIGTLHAGQRPTALKVAVLEWFEPIFPGGHWTPQLVKMAGAEHPLNPARGTGGAMPSFAVETSALAEADCDWIIICPCGLDLEETAVELKAIQGKQWWEDLRAVREKRVVCVDGNQHFNRPGPRLVDALEFLTGLLNNESEIIPPGFPWKWLHDMHGTNGNLDTANGH